MNEQLFENPPINNIKCDGNIRWRLCVSFLICNCPDYTDIGNIQNLNFYKGLG